MRPGLLGLVGAADQHRVGVHADQLAALEVVEDARHRQREHALALEHARGDAAGRLQLVVVDREAERAQLLAELRARHRRRVRDEADPVAGGAQPPDGVDGSGDRLAGDVQHAVHVEQNRRHGRRVYSLGSRLPVLPVERPRRPARAEELDPRRGAVRRRGLGGADRRRARGACSSGSARSCARSPRTSARSSATASSRPTGSSSSCARRRRSGGRGARRSRRAASQRAAARGEAPAGADEAPAPPAGRLSDGAPDEKIRGGPLELRHSA